jgi:hypothetical protein
MLALHSLAIVLHALSGIAAFAVGVVLLAQTDSRREVMLGKAFLALVASLEVFLIVAILTTSESLLPATRAIFFALAVLGLFMIWEGVQALRILQKTPLDQVALLGHVGFNLISLFVAFAVVSAIDLGASPWLVGVSAILATSAGIVAINKRKRTLLGGGT